jgi:nucleoid-associated protein YgaU
MSFGDLLVTGATWALGVGALWAVVIVAAAVLEVVSSGHCALTARLGCPAPARRALLAGLGVVLASGGAVVAGPASATPAPLTQSGRGQLGLPVPARPTGSPDVLPHPRVEVRPGDSLWRISTHHLHGTFSDQDVVRLVARTYRANRTVIGADPDLIRPGQQLRIPRQHPTHRTHADGRLP